MRDHPLGHSSAIVDTYADATDGMDPTSKGAGGRQQPRRRAITLNHRFTLIRQGYTPEYIHKDTPRTHRTVQFTTTAEEQAKAEQMVGTQMGELHLDDADDVRPLSPSDASTSPGGEK